MAKITPRDNEKKDAVKVVRTQKRPDLASGSLWWTAKSKKERAAQVIETFAFLKENQQYRMRQASLHARLYGNIPLSNWAGSTLNRLGPGQLGLPVDRPTMNVVQSCVDTLVSRICQSKPRPIFLTDGADYKQQRLAKQLNNFIDGELYRTEAYTLAEEALRDAGIIGDGVIKIFENNKKVCLERVLATELFVDSNEAFYGKPRSMYQAKLVDRSQLIATFPDFKSIVEQAEQAYPDSGGESQRTVADQVIVVEAWHLPSIEGADDGYHVIACSAGSLLDESYEKNDFPFVFLPYSPRLIGKWSQGLSEQLMGTQIEINKLLVTISKSINLVGVPRVFIEDGSKVVKAHFNSEIGSIITYRGALPTIVDGTSGIAADIYAQLQRLIEYAYQQSGISSLAATSQKPQGLDSGTALREYDDLQSDRFATVNKRYNKLFIDLAYKIIDLAKDICDRDGKYATVYPSKDGTQEVDLPASKLLDNPYVIQCYDQSSLPRDPAGRAQTIVERMQAGIYTLEEGRKLLGTPDLERDDKLRDAAKNRILMQLDDIVESGSYEPPDPFTDLAAAEQLAVQYYNLYSAVKLEESKAELLRTYISQVQMLKAGALAAAAPPPGAPMPGGDPAAQGGAPIAQPQAPPTSNLLPVAPQ